MKQFSLIVLAAISLLFISRSNSKTVETQRINPLIGDASYRAEFGKQPDHLTDEDLRIKTHLAYVESRLRHKDISKMSETLRNKREHLLDLLHQYWTAGVFPRNYDHSEKRVPCFIDKNGTICAVGFLVEQTAGRAAAEEINSRHKYDEVLAMNDEVVDNWVASSGLTKEECAMIQPNYGWQPSYDNMPAGYALGSSVLAGANVALSAINVVNLLKPVPYNKTIGGISMITGAGSVFFGVWGMVEADSHGWSENNKSGTAMMSIGIGTATMILGARNAFAKNPVKDKPVSWNLHSQPTMTGETAVGLCFTKKL